MCSTNSSYSTCPWLSSKPTKSWSTSSAVNLSPRLHSTWRNSAAVTNPLQFRSNTRRHSIKYSGSTKKETDKHVQYNWQKCGSILCLSTIHRSPFASPRKPYRIGPCSATTNVDFGAIFVPERRSLLRSWKCQRICLSELKLSDTSSGLSTVAQFLGVAFPPFPPISRLTSEFLSCTKCPLAHEPSWELGRENVTGFARQLTRHVKSFLNLLQHIKCYRVECTWTTSCTIFSCFQSHHPQKI